MSITDWPLAERPRERLLEKGPEALSDAELLAIYLRVGVRGQSAVSLARTVLQRFEGNLGALANATVAELSSIPGIGLAKAAQLKASFELTRRALLQDLKQRDVLNAPAAVQRWLALHLGHRPREVFMALWLDQQHRLIQAEELFEGTLSSAAVYPRELVRSALHLNAAAVILAHNHPSGVAEPSTADQRLTAEIEKAMATIDVRVLDHLIIGGHHCHSLMHGPQSLG